MITYWLQYGGQYVATVRGDSDLSENEIRRLALDAHERLPLVDCYEAPFERANKIRHARIRVFD